MSSSQQMRRKLESKFGTIADEAWQYLEQELGYLSSYDCEEDFWESAKMLFRFHSLCGGARVRTERRATASRKKRVHYVKPLLQNLELVTRVDPWRIMSQIEAAFRGHYARFSWPAMAEYCDGLFRGSGDGHGHENKTYTGEACKRAYYRAKNDFPCPTAARLFVGEYISALRGGETTLRAPQWIDERMRSAGLEVVPGRTIYYSNNGNNSIWLDYLHAPSGDNHLDSASAGQTGLQAHLDTVRRDARRKRQAG